MEKSLEKTTSTYSTLVQRLAKTSPTYKALDDFLGITDHVTQSPAKFTVLKIRSEDPNSHGLQLDHFDGTARLAEELESTDSEDACRLFMVENVCAQTISLLGERFDIDPQFFADHLNNEPWYRIAEVADRLPALPSAQKLHDFLQLRYVEPRQLSNFQYPFYASSSLSTGKGVSTSISSDAMSFMYPDEVTTRIPRKAGKFNPRLRQGREFEPLLCTRQAITVWFKKKDTGLKGWTGITETEERSYWQGLTFNRSNTS